MKAPDKVFVKKEEIKMQSDNLVGVAWKKNYDDSQYVEYIRKDVLMEWVRERLDFACALKSEGQKTVCKELIDKLESM